MAKINPVAFTRKNKAGESYAFKGECSVGNDGVFSVHIPDDLVPLAQKLALDRRNEPGAVRVTKPRVNWRAEASTLVACEAFLQAVVQEFLAVDVSRDRVICYAHDSAIAIFENADGSLHPNGSFGHYPTGKWRGTLDGSNKQDSRYRIAFVARAFDRVTYTRPSYVKVEFLRPDEAHHDTGPLGRLNGFAGLGNFVPTDATPAMPYSDEAAEFFVNMMLGMCALSRKLDAFLGDPDRIALAIAGGQGVLGYNGKGSASDSAD